MKAIDAPLPSPQKKKKKKKKNKGEFTWKCYILLGESQKGINAFERCSVENQMGAITIDFI